MKKRIIFISLAILWMLVIFLFSNQTGNDSGDLSDKIVHIVIRVIYGNDFASFPLERQEAINNIFRFIIRKLAHFSIFGILATFYYLALASFKVNYWNFIYSLGLTFIYATIDEWHQSFVGGRTPAMLDVLIDTLGGLAFLIVIFIIKIIKERKNNNVY